MACQNRNLPRHLEAVGIRAIVFRKLTAIGSIYIAPDCHLTTSGFECLLDCSGGTTFSIWPYYHYLHHSTIIITGAWPGTPVSYDKEIDSCRGGRMSTPLTKFRPGLTHLNKCMRPTASPSPQLPFLQVVTRTWSPASVTPTWWRGGTLRCRCSTHATSEVGFSSLRTPFLYCITRQCLVAQFSLVITQQLLRIPSCLY